MVDAIRSTVGIDPQPPPAPNSVEGRFGLLGHSWGPMRPAGRRLRERLGITWGEQILLEQLIYHHREKGFWESLAQSLIAGELGVERTTVNGRLGDLRKRGLTATRGDPRHGTPSKTLH